jgi:hypothetical protein
MMKLEMRKLQRRAARPAPALPASRPRPVRLTGTGWFVAVLGMLLLAGAPVAGFWLHATAVRDRTLRKAIDKEGVRVTAVVSDLIRTRGNEPKYYAVYRYSAGGQVHQGRANLNQSYWTGLSVGNTFPVRYLPSEPGRSWLLGREPGGVPFWVGPLAALCLAGSGMIPWYAIRRQWMLLAEGRPAQAQVTASKKVRHQHGSYYRVRYEFRTMSGATRSGRYDSRKGPPASGTTIQVVYNPDWPEHSMPYPFALVRPA